MLRSLPFLLELALLVYALADCIQTPEGECRNLQKTLWVLIIIFLPIVGPIVWFVAGRPARAHQRNRTPWPSGPTAGFPEYERPGHYGGRRALAPDDDPEFLNQLRAHNSEHEKLLNEWEANLKRREQELRRNGEGDQGGNSDETPSV